MSGASRSKAPKRPRDLNEWAKRLVDIATGEASDGEPTQKNWAKTHGLSHAES